MEFSSSPSLDLVALVDPAARGTAPPLASDRCGDAAGDVGLAFELCLGQLLPVVPGGETLPPTGNDLPGVAIENVAPDAEMTAEALALTLPGWMTLPASGTASVLTGTALAGAASSTATLSAGGAPAAVDVGTQLLGTPLVQSAAAERSPTAAASAAQTAAPTSTSIDSSALTASSADTVADGSSASAQTTATDDGAAPTTAPVDAASGAEDYTAIAANAAVRGDSANAPRRVDDALRGVRMSMRDARQANGTTTAAPPALPAADVSASNAASATSAVTPAAPLLRGELATQGRAQNAEGATPVVDIAAPAAGHGAWLAPGTAAAQNASSTSPNAPGASAQHAPVDTTQPRWQEAFASRVQWLADQNVGEAHLRLNPPDLGTVDVKISLVEDRTFVHLTTHTAAARDELAQSLPRLRELFAASGLELGGASVQNGRDGQARYDGQPPERGYSGREPAATNASERPGSPAARRSGGGIGRIDLFA